MTVRSDPDTVVADILAGRGVITADTLVEKGVITADILAGKEVTGAVDILVVREVKSAAGTRVVRGVNGDPVVTPVRREVINTVLVGINVTGAGPLPPRDTEPYWITSILYLI